VRIASWNVNSIRTRLEQVLAWLAVNPDLDVLCLQETKVEDSKFPFAELHDRGYRVYVSGQKSYNGVAFISRQELTSVQIGFQSLLNPEQVGDLDDQKRLISGVIAGVRIVNLYVPNGSDITSEKYAYKLAWLDLLKEYLKILLSQEKAVVICGDFNIALTDLDIHNPEGRENAVMATDRERSSLQSVLELGFVDILRKFSPDGGNYTWWDYRGGAFRRNLGWRIDYHFISQALHDRALDCTVDVSPRRNPQPSDHAPVILTLA
jgi:exodeoxyribonuclease-3